ncbi:hypothetical protein M758_10G039200 [Ceratodon purpureus]|nr:hypothetical protein M758_10G039200 [Ceratodon purpureus]
MVLLLGLSCVLCVGGGDCLCCFVSRCGSSSF